MHKKAKTVFVILKSSCPIQEILRVALFTYLDRVQKRLRSPTSDPTQPKLLLSLKEGKQKINLQLPF